MAMNRRPITVLGTGVAAALAASLLAAPAQAAPSADPGLFCDLPGEELAISPIADLVVDEPVTWLSTVSGIAPTEFSGTYLGRLPNALGHDAYGNQRDLLLVELSGPVVDGSGSTLPAGVWAGASGSPVYDEDGALIGAVSYGFSGEADNVAGVTPAAAMKSIGDLPASVQVNAAGRQMVQAATGVSPGRSMTQLQPVKVENGRTGNLFEKTEKRLKQAVKGFKTVGATGRAGGVVGADAEAIPSIVPGGNIAVSYAHGALWDATVGTVTAVCGDQVWAYGHPNTGNSKFKASFHGASAARVVPSAGDSYKLIAEIGAPMGRLTDDRTAGVRGTLGETFPAVKVTTVSKVGGTSSTAVTNVTEKLDIAPVAAVQLGGDALRMLDNAWAGSATVRWSIDYTRANGRTGTLTNTDKYADDMYLPDLVGWGVAEDIAALQYNGFETVTVTGVRITADFSDQVRVARVAGFERKSGTGWKKVPAGSTVQASRGKSYDYRAVLRPAPNADGGTSYLPFTVTVPKSIKKTLKVRLTGATPLFEDGELVIGSDDGAPVRNFDQYVAALDDRSRSDRVTVTRRYTSASGANQVKTSRKTAPTVVDGGQRSFMLQVAVEKSKKRR
ncbi:hypothetical protein ACFPZL_06255 [Leucobacter soli]|uniref:Peptidase S55 domain-containing protein n=1 Tax=Leucobacter soli TaxID=2812850 RepID=A0A916JY42_9MICO|nr:hypothetical protein [Leucobacter soli]CAG7605447.1 hypothetical protein LEUCIP111803_00829 [Leucobacter soli]